MGASVAPSVSEADLDAHVAQLILKEAKQKAERYAQLGISALVAQCVPFPPFILAIAEGYECRKEGKAASTDKRFLTSILRRTDDHNRAVLRTQAEQAAAIKQQREEEERAERRARAEEAAEAERLRRRSHRSSRRSERNDGRRDRRDYDRRDRDRHRERSVDRRSDEEDDRVWRESRREGKRRALEDNDEDAPRHSSHKRTRRSSRDDNRRTRSRRAGSSSRTASASPGPSSREDSSSKHAHSRQRQRSRSQDDVQSRKPLRQHEPSRDRGDHASRRDDHDSKPPVRPKDPVSEEESLSLPAQPKEHINTEFHWRRSRSPGDTDTRSERSRRRRSYSPSTSGNTPGPPSPPRLTSASVHRTLKSAGPPPPSTAPPPMPRSPPPPLRPRGRGAASKPDPGAAGLSSKMDRYFDATYDPRLDVAKLTAPAIPATGLLDDADFAGWDAMLDLIRVRRQEKEERKWLEKHGVKPTPVEELGVMDIQYKKRGSVREWDMGKDGVD
jgi:hypothetical protein